MKNIFSRNTFLLIIGLLLIIAILVTLIFFNRKKEVEEKPIPVFNQPSSSPLQTVPQDPLQIQTEADINYTEAQNKVLQEFPWYNHLPLQDSNYFVLFDLPRKVLRAKLYPQQSSPVSTEGQVAVFQQEITQKLQQLNIDTNLYKIEWTIIPE